MVKWQIGTYARLRPTRRGLEHAKFYLDNKSLSFPPLDESLKQRDALHFNFNQVFDSSVSQEYVFEVVCQDIVRSALDGINGTIFAYGQTGSGKTYTITGGDHYADRGIIPRVLSMLFEAFEQRNQSRFACYISYLEIYNESVYDLLDRSHADRPIEEWTKVLLMDDDEGDMHFRNLGVYEAVSEEEALNLLFLGNMNRVTSDTPMNLASSRSHAIFSIIIESRTMDSPVITTSKLHLVDLAGSERVYKREGTQRMRNEGKHINLSLHHLEQVILSLTAKHGNEQQQQQVAKTFHVPYRNSMLTSVLRGSLGGNCKSVFIATLNPENEYVEESISTCRFMQRCSEVAVDVGVNHEVDPEAQVARLESENQQLLAQQHQLQQQVDELQQENELFRALVASPKPVDWDLCEALVDKLLACGQVPFRDSDQVQVPTTPPSNSDNGNIQTQSQTSGQDTNTTMVLPPMEQEEETENLGLTTNRQQHEAIVSQIRAKGIHFVVGCLNVLKDNTIVASNAVIELEESLNEQRRTIELLEKRINDQKHDAESLKQQLRTLEGQTLSQNQNHPRQPMAATSLTLPAVVASLGGTSTIPVNSFGPVTSRVLRSNDSGSSRSSPLDEPRGGASAGGSGQGSPQTGRSSRLVLPSPEDQHDTDTHPVNPVQEVRVVPRLAKSSTMYLPPPPPTTPPPLNKTNSTPYAGATTTTTTTSYNNNNNNNNSPTSSRNLTSELVRKRTDLLCNGNMFIKHGRYGRPHVRFVWCSNDLEYLFYRELTSAVPSVSIPTRNFVRVLLGQQTKVFARVAAKRNHADDLCFSIEYLDNRSLDLEVSDGDGDDVDAKKAKRNEWVDALQFLLKMKTVQKQRKRSFQTVPIPQQVQQSPTTSTG